MTTAAPLRADELRAAVAAALPAAAERRSAEWLAAERASAEWALDACGAGSDAVARAQVGWLVIEAPAAPRHSGFSAARELRRSARLPAGVKLVIGSDAAGHRALRLRAEIPAWRGVDLAARLGSAVAALAAARAVDGSAAGLGAEAAGLAPAAPVPDIARLCSDAGWPCAERSPERVAVEIGDESGYRQALVAWDAAAGEVRASAALDVGGASLGLAGERVDAAGTDGGHEAAALLLLRVAGAIRLVRAAADDAGDGLRLEVALAGSPALEDLDAALAALSVATRACAREVHCLSRDPTAARTYLRREGFRPPMGGAPEEAAGDTPAGTGRAPR